MKGFRGVSEEVVRARTGRPSAEWYRLLDDWDAAEKGHMLAARHLREEHGLSPWWAQCLTIRWEWERGLRG